MIFFDRKKYIKMYILGITLNAKVPLTAKIHLLLVLNSDKKQLDEVLLSRLVSKNSVLYRKSLEIRDLWI
jgi:hypothetical protein